jgi:hypothetical protein
VTTYLVFSVFTSRVASLLATTKACVVKRVRKTAKSDS